MERAGVVQRSCSTAPGGRHEDGLVRPAHGHGRWRGRHCLLHPALCRGLRHRGWGARRGRPRAGGLELPSRWRCLLQDRQLGRVQRMPQREHRPQRHGRRHRGQPDQRCDGNTADTARRQRILRPGRPEQRRDHARGQPADDGGDGCVRLGRDRRGLSGLCVGIRLPCAWTAGRAGRLHTDVPDPAAEGRAPPDHGLRRRDLRPRRPSPA